MTYANGLGTGQVTGRSERDCGWDVWSPEVSPRQVSPRQVSPRHVSPGSTTQMPLLPVPSAARGLPMHEGAYSRGVGKPWAQVSSSPQPMSRRGPSHHRMQGPTAINPAGGSCGSGPGVVLGRARRAPASILVWGWWHWSGRAWIWCSQHVGAQQHVPASAAPVAAFGPRPPYLEPAYYWPDAAGRMVNAYGQAPAYPVASTIALPSQAANAIGGSWARTPLGQVFFVPAGWPLAQALRATPAEPWPGGGNCGGACGQ